MTFNIIQIVIGIFVLFEARKFRPALRSMSEPDNSWGDGETAAFLGFFAVVLALGLGLVIWGLIGLAD